MAVADWSGQDWALALGGVTVLVTGIGGFITNMVTLRRVGKVEKKVDGMLVQRDASNFDEGERKGERTGADRAATLAEGQRQGREHEREHARSDHLHSSDQPVPVKDDQAAVIAERNVQATESIAASAKEANVLAKKE